MSNTSPMWRVIAAAVESNTPILAWGQPGEAKSSLIEQHGQAWGRHVETLTGTNREGYDFMGLLRDDGSYTELAWARRLMDAPKALLFVDELGSVRPSVQAAMMRVTQERVVGETALPDTVSIIAAANPIDVAVGGWDLGGPVANRFCHLDWSFDTNAWLDGLLTGFVDYEAPTIQSLIGEDDRTVRARVTGTVAAFLRHSPALIAPGQPTNPVEYGRGWPSPRSWHNATKILGRLRIEDDSAAMLALRGCVGEGAATEFLTWQVSLDLANPADVMKNPNIIDWSDERPDRLFALVNSVTALARMDLAEGRTESWERAMAVLVACAEGGRPDAAVPSAQALIGLRPEGSRLTDEHREAFAPLLRRMGRFAEEGEAA